MTNKYVYAITSGAYDSYRVHGVYLTCKEAKAAVKLLGTRYVWHRLPIYTELPQRQDVHRRSISVWDDGTSGEEPSAWVCTEWDIDPVFWDALVPAGAQWTRHPAFKGKGGQLNVYGLDEVLVETLFAELLEELRSNPDLRLKRSWKR